MFHTKFNSIYILTFVIIVLNLNNLSVESGIIDNTIEQYADLNGNCNIPDKLIDEIKGYQTTVNRISDEIVKGQYAGDTWNSLSTFIDTFGPRMSGSQNLENAIDYMVTTLTDAGLENVHTENATVPHWVRGFESAQLILPHIQNLPILGLGSTIGTPRGGIVGEVVAVESFDEFSNLTDAEVSGKIVVFAPKWEGYGKTVLYRSRAASVASNKGAVAALVRSTTPFSIGSPHTGMQRYAKGARKIPVAALTIEDAEMLLRIYRRGDQIQIRLEMEDRNFDATVSRNTIAELKGSSLETQNRSVVVVSGHLDSWDVGVGAMDDGGGAFIAWKSLDFLNKMNLRPRRTIRSILWTGEEQGIVGAQEYAKQHISQEKEEFNFFIESDIGTFEPRGLDFSGNADAKCIFQEILKLFSPLNATEFAEPTDGGPDIETWTSKGFPGASLLNKNEKYFWFHHSAGDSMLLESSPNLDKGAAIFAAISYIIADLSVDMPKKVD